MKNTMTKEKFLAQARNEGFDLLRNLFYTSSHSEERSGCRIGVFYNWVKRIFQSDAISHGTVQLEKNRKGKQIAAEIYSCDIFPGSDIVSTDDFESVRTELDSLSKKIIGKSIENHNSLYSFVRENIENREIESIWNDVSEECIENFASDYASDHFQSFLSKCLQYYERYWGKECEEDAS